MTRAGSRYAGRALLLDRWTWQRAVGAEDAAIAALGPQHLAAAFARVEPDAGVGWHRFAGLMAAMRAGQR